MAKKVLALNTDGQLTYCTAPEELRGRGRCNHVEHQGDNQTMEQFLEQVESRMQVSGEIDENLTILEQLDPTLLDPRSTSKRLGLRVDIDDDVEDQTRFTEELIKAYGHIRKPKWDKIVEKVDSLHKFDIGSPELEGYRHADLVGVKTIHHEDFDGDSDEIIATYEFEGEKYTMSWGKMPTVQDDGIIRLNGTDWRFLPMIENHKAGLAAFGGGVQVQQKDGNLAFSLRYPKEPELDQDGNPIYWVRSYGQQIPLHKVRDYINGTWDGTNNGDGYALKPGPKFGLKRENLDPAFLERFPEFLTDETVILGLPADEANDLTDRRVVRYEDAVETIMAEQARRVTGTFRSNLLKRDKFGEGMTKEELDEKYPLFYQQNMTENVKKKLAGASNVQFAEKLNAFAALSQSQKIALTGPGGYSKDNPPKALRYPHASHKDLIDGTDASAGGNIGLTITLANGYIGDDRMIHKNPEGTEHGSLKDFVPFMNHNNPARSVLSEAHLKQSVPIVGGEDPLVDTPAWKYMKGAKLGTNLRVAYIPSVGTFEDAVVISESAAKKMGTYQNKHVRLDEDEEPGVKIGDKLVRNDKIGRQNVEFDAEVIGIDENGVTLRQFFAMKTGDKISGFSGNKGTVSKIVPDSEMPKMTNPQGLEEPVQIVMSPMGVGGRRNIGQVMETNMNFDGKPNVDSKRDVKLPDGHKIKATGGVQYIHRLNHIADKKLSSVANEKGQTREFKGGRLSEMESILMSHSEDRLEILRYIRNQEGSDARNKLTNLLHAIGSDVEGEGFNLKD